MNSLTITGKTTIPTFSTFSQHHISPVIKELRCNKIALKCFSLDLISMIYMFFRKKKFAKIGPWKTTYICICLGLGLYARRANSTEVKISRYCSYSRYRGPKIILFISKYMFLGSKNLFLVLFNVYACAILQFKMATILKMFCLWGLLDITDYFSAK